MLGGQRGNKMGSIGTSNPTIYSGFKYFLDKNDGDEDFAIKDYLYENLIRDTLEYQGKEYEVAWENTVRPKIIERPVAGDAFNKDLVVTAEVDLRDPETGKMIYNYYVIKDDTHPRKHKKFYIPYYA